ncbi:hypothetical protein QBC46DRAFT_437685 [Diplogelasinospora grovesii]|uniref:SH3 domain-containing protein n=1 Tax=Diplogelasinospora grovesii TaxID=303347 RepID=A0AAN6S9L9_9PEZI|nr:hypothetical protein QBC46DRAFT_437685 [Diplogelasinospora grovesii]
MDDDVHDLVLGPFRDVVAKGKTAVENAKEAGAQPMQKAAQSLVSNGERALKKIEPLCKRQLDEYGPNFVDALKENDDISGFREQLNEMLWDLEDAVEADGFDAEIYTKLQTTLRAAALKISDIVVRMKLEHPHIEPELSVVSEMSRAPSAALSHISDTQQIYPPSPLPDQTPRSVPQTEYIHPVDEAIVMEAKAGPVQSWDDRQRTEVQAQQLANGVEALGIVEEVVEPQQRSAESVLPEEIPPEPSIDPWQATKQLPTNAINLAEGEGNEQLERRPRLLSGGDEPGLISPITPHQEETSVFPTTQRPRRLDIGVEHMMRQEQGQRQKHTPPGAADDNNPWRNTLPSQRPPSATLTSSVGDGDSTAASSNESIQGSVYTSSPRGSRGARDSLVSPLTGTRNSVQSNPDFQIQTSPSVASPRDSVYSVAEQTQALPTLTAALAASWSSTAATAQPIIPILNHGHGYHPRLPTVPQEGSNLSDQPGLEAVVQPVEDGLIPVMDETTGQQQQAGGSGQGTSPQTPAPTRQPDCNIDLRSSFYQYKGFCEGAKEIIRGDLGVRKVKKPGIGAGTVIVAKCRHCMFELIWKGVEADLNRSSDANYTTANVSFRLRFLSKSHLPARHIDDQLYGCLFCIHSGRTCEESDATVFFTQKQLFAHLARHPRPLPHVPGLKVVDAQQVPPELRNDYDLHFTHPPGTVTNSALRTPPDRAAVLQFAAGAKIVGVEFPAKYNGEWGIGWADNVRAAFPLDCVRLSPPEKRDVRMQATSNMSAVARWKRHPREKNGKDKDQMVQWLKFDRGEVITSISFPYTEHWCWSGYNARGKWGIFPQSFIEPNTLREAPTGDRASNWSNEGKTGVFARMSTRRPRVGSRPESSASHSSGEAPTITGGQHSPRPSIY